MNTAQLRRRLRRIRRRYGRMYCYRPSRGRDRLIGLAAGVALIAVFGHHAATSHPGPARASTAAVIVSGDLGSPAGWARALLAADHDPVTACNITAVTAWEHFEGGGFGNQAAYNPLNTNPGPGAGWPGHPAIGAWAFPDAATGLAYTVRVLHQPDMAGIRRALAARGPPQAVCDAIMASPWAASHYDGRLEATC